LSGISYSHVLWNKLADMNESGSWLIQVHTEKSIKTMLCVGYLILKTFTVTFYSEIWRLFFVSLVIIPLVGTLNSPASIFYLIYVDLNLCVCSLFLIHRHSFEQICTKFGLWHPYSLHMVMGVRVTEHRLSQRAWIGKCNGSSPLSARCGRAL